MVISRPSLQPAPPRNAFCPWNSGKEFFGSILLTPTTKSTVDLSKVLGSTIPVMIAAAALFGVSFAGNPLMWAGRILGIFLLGLGMSCFFLAMTTSSTD